MRQRSFQSSPELEPTKETTPKAKRYKVMLQDYFDKEWIDCGDESYWFDTEEEAIKRRDELNLKEFGTTTPSYDHYGVMEMSTKHRGHEIKCPATFGRS